MLARYHKVAARYDRRARFGNRLRARAVERLALRPGDTVFDVGCGTGLSFPFLHAAVGPQGRIVGIELSPEMATQARTRASQQGWSNVTVVEAAVEEASIPIRANAVLSFLTHDILQSRPALENVFRHTAPGGRVSALGVKWASWWLAPLNVVVWLGSRPYVTTFRGFGRPWSLLGDFVPQLRVEPLALGALYLADGAVPAP